MNEFRLSRIAILLIAAGLILCGILLYGYAFGLPYHIDDYVQFRWLQDKTMWQVWTQHDRGYYRPLQFALWKLVYLLTGAYQPSILHSFNVLPHALNGVLVFALLWSFFFRAERWQGVVASAISSLLFLTFPFSYQAVPWIGALAHPLVTTFILAALVLAQLAHTSHGRHSTGLSIASLACTLAAPFTHEVGVLVGPLLTLMYATSQCAPRGRALVASVWPYWLLACLPQLLVVLGRAGQLGSTTLESKWQNAVYFLQGLAFPFAPFGGLLVRPPIGLNDIAAVLVVCIPALALMVMWLWKMGQLRVALCGVGWYAITCLPSWWLLPFSYVIDGPRLMYEASVGAAMLVGALTLAALRLFPIRRINTSVRQVVSGLAAATLLIVSLAFNLAFLRDRAAMFEQTRFIADAFLPALGPSAANGKLAIAVNVPTFLAATQPTYALGHDGVTFIPEYSSMIDLFWLQTGRDKPVATVVLSHLQTPWRFVYANHGVSYESAPLQSELRKADRVLFTSRRDANLALYDAGNLESVQAPQQASYLSDYAQQLTLLSATHERAEQDLKVTLRWQLRQAPSQEIRTFVHLQSEMGELIAQEDGLPLMNIADPRTWQPGDVWRDVRVLKLPPVLEPGKYVLRAGVYLASSGARLTATAPDGSRFADDSAPIITFEVR